LLLLQWLMLLGGTISLVVSSGSMLMLPQFAGDIIDAVSKDGGAFHSLLLVAALIAKVLSTCRADCSIDLAQRRNSTAPSSRWPSR
jgi:purine-cytosine permease-like protein